MKSFISDVLFENIYEIMKDKISVDKQAFVSVCTENATVNSMNEVLRTIAKNADRTQYKQIESEISIARGKAKLIHLLRYHI
jgi:hypothetical protein